MRTTLKRGTRGVHTNGRGSRPPVPGAFSGGGFRTKQRQIELRKINGCPDVWTAPSSSCRVPTVTTNGWPTGSRSGSSSRTVR